MMCGTVELMGCDVGRGPLCVGFSEISKCSSKTKVLLYHDVKYQASVFALIVCRVVFLPRGNGLVVDDRGGRDPCSSTMAVPGRGCDVCRWYYHHNTSFQYQNHSTIPPNSSSYLKDTLAFQSHLRSFYLSHSKTVPTATSTR